MQLDSISYKVYMVDTMAILHDSLWVRAEWVPKSLDSFRVIVSPSQSFMKMPEMPDDSIAPPESWTAVYPKTSAYEDYIADHPYFSGGIILSVITLAFLLLKIKRSWHGHFKDWLSEHGDPEKYKTDKVYKEFIEGVYEEYRDKGDREELPEGIIEYSGDIPPSYIDLKGGLLDDNQNKNNEEQK